MLLLLASCTTIAWFCLQAMIIYGGMHQVQGIAKKMLVDCGSLWPDTVFFLCSSISKFGVAHQLELERYHSPHQRIWLTANLYAPVREAVSYRGLFTAGCFGVREKYCSRLEIYDRLRASEQAHVPLCATIQYT